jgi:hypothetical protein
LRPPIGKDDSPQREPAGAQRRFEIVIDSTDPEPTLSVSRRLRSYGA